MLLSFQYKKEMDLRSSPLMIVIGRFEMDMLNLIGPRYLLNTILVLLNGREIIRSVFET